MTKQTRRAGVFFDTSVRHSVEVERYTSGVVRRMLALMARTEEDILRRIRDLDPDSRTAVALEQRLAAIRAEQERSEQLLKDALNREVGEFAAYEATFVARAGQVAAARAGVDIEWNGVTREQVRAAAMSRPFAGVHLKFANLNEQLDEASKRKAALVRDTVRKGFLEGRGIYDIVRDLRGTKANGYADGLLTRSARTTEAIVRTAITHTATAAREEVYKVNAHQIKGVQWVSVLDQRTSSICQGLDGQIFEMDKGPRPPAHPNCRSTTVPVFRGEEPVKKTTFSDWLAERSTAEQDEILGPSRAKLFRDGGVKLDRFVNESGKTYTLAELQTREAEAFARAGIK